MALSVTEVLVFVDRREVARHPLGVGAHTFGSSAECSILIEAAHVSGHHARITVAEDDSLLLEDLGSTSGTFLDGFRISAPTPFDPEQSIQIGTANLLVRQEVAGTGDGNGLPPELTQVIRYEPGAEIAKGGMGAILAARQPAIRREVALKVMLRNASAHDRLRFIEEAQITGQLEHPNIVPVHDLALNEHGQPYYTMKLVKGSTLRDVLKLLTAGDPATIAKYSLAALVTTFQKICDAVAFAHARGVIHRDLKPANIMVGEFGEVLVMDWGLAKVLRPEHSPMTGTPTVSSAREDQRDVFATLDGAVMGTPHYMSPEQALGEVDTLDQRSDIYSLGAILYQLVTLVPPFTGRTTREILAQLQHGSCLLPNARLRAAGPARPGHLRGGAIPDSLEAVIMKALAPDRDQRYQRVEDFQADLTAYQNGFATSAEKARAWKQVKLLVLRHKAASLGILAVFLTGISFGSKVVVEKNRANAALADSRQQEAAQRRSLHEASMADYGAALQKLEHDETWSVGIAHLARALKWEPSNSLAAVRLYSALSLYGPDKLSRLQQLYRHRGKVLNAQFSPDGSRVLTASEEKIARVWDTATGEAVGEPMRHGGAVNSAQFSPDGSRVVTASSDATARVWGAATGKPLGEPLRHQSAVDSAQFSPDGTRVVTASSDGTARVWDAATGKPAGEPLRHESYVNSAEFSSDGTRVVTASEDHTARVWNSATSEAVGEPLRHSERVNSARFSRDGTRVVTASDDYTARVWDAATGKAIGEPLRHDSGVYTAEFSPDGTRVITGSDDNTARLWDAATGNAVAHRLRHHDGVYSVQFSPDGARVVTASDDKTARLWDASSGAALSESLRHDGTVSSARFSPDGTRVVTASSDGTARLWDAATGAVAGKLLRHDGDVNSAQFSPNGLRVLTASDDKTARMWDTATGEAVGEPLRHDFALSSAQFSADGRRVVTESGGTARVWDAVNGSALGEPLHHVDSAQFSPDGTRLVTASSDDTARVWDATTGKALGKPFQHNGSVRSAQFSPDGTRFVTACIDNTARVWNASSGQPVGEPLRHDVNLGGMNSAQFSPDGARVITASSDKTAQIWDAATGKAVGERLRHDSVVWSAQFSPESSRVVTASYDKTAQVWNSASGHAVGKPLQHNGWVLSAQFSSDGTRVVTASSDGTARVWDAATGNALGEPLRHENIVRSAQFSRDGTRVVTASGDGTARLWDAANLKDAAIPTPAWLPDLVYAITGYDFGENAELRSMAPEDRLAALRLPIPGHDAWAVVARWLSLPPAERPHTTDSHVSNRQLAARERDFGSRYSLQSALRYDPTVPLARLLLAGALQREDAELEAAERDPNLPQRAAFLRDYDFARMPSDPALWERAARALHEQKDDARTLRALEELRKLAPEKEVAVRKELGL
jgi:WD40 repeat protein/tRNA A-37 threonylcarbamoyl transferase component Bud32